MRLHDRVAKEENKKVDDIDIDIHPRTCTKKFNEAIRQVQKKVRGLGYGLGTKLNVVTGEVLMMSDES